MLNYFLSEIHSRAIAIEMCLTASDSPTTARLGQPREGHQQVSPTTRAAAGSSVPIGKEVLMLSPQPKRGSLAGDAIGNGRKRV